MEHEPENERPLLHSTRLPPAPTTELRPSDDQETRAQELRDALGELKADIDGRPRAKSASAPAPGGGATSTPQSSASSSASPSASSSASPSVSPSVSPSASSSAGTASDGRDASLGARYGRRLALGTLAAVAVLAGVVGVVRVVAWSVAGARDIRSPAASGTGHSAPSPSVPAASPTVATPGRASPSTSPPPAASPPLALPSDLPRSGPGADAPGAELTAVLEHGDAVVVYERLVVRPGTTSVQLRPAPVQALRRNLQGAGFTVTGLRVVVDGRPVTAPGDSQGGWRVARPDGRAFTQLVLRYQLAGAVVRATPAPPGRGTLVLRPITGAQASLAHDPVVVRLRDRRVGQVYCPSGPQPLCDTVRGIAHFATVPAGAPPIVLAQVTLP